MNIFKRYNLKKIALLVLWVSIGACSIVLLVAAVHKKDSNRCKGIEINISGVSNNFFIDKSDVMKIITSRVGINAIGKPVDAFNLRAMETALRNEIWIKDAELYFDNNDIMQASVEEREPISRIFTVQGNSFYIDKTRMILPLSDKLSARLPVFTGFPTDNRVLSKADSNLLTDINSLSVLIQQDSFLMSMIEQVDITAKRNFELIPKIGNQLIVFGDASDAAQKFSKLRLFYKNIITKYGWNKYSQISLQYKGQVVAKIRDAEDFSADSLRTIQIMQTIAANSARMASDSLQTFMQDNEKNSTDVSIIQQSMEREEATEPDLPFEKLIPGNQFVPVPKPIDKPAVKPGAGNKKPIKAANRNTKPAVKKPAAIAKPATVKPSVVKPAVAKPKVVMPKKNDY
jgi:cell division protein FtsQ